MRLNQLLSSQQVSKKKTQPPHTLSQNLRIVLHTVIISTITFKQEIFKQFPHLWALFLLLSADNKSFVKGNRSDMIFDERDLLFHASKTFAAPREVFFPSSRNLLPCKILGRFFLEKYILIFILHCSPWKKNHREKSHFLEVFYYVITDSINLLVNALGCLFTDE